MQRIFLLVSYRTRWASFLHHLLISRNWADAATLELDEQVGLIYWSHLIIQFHKNCYLSLFLEMNWNRTFYHWLISWIVSQLFIKYELSAKCFCLAAWNSVGSQEVEERSSPAQWCLFLICGLKSLETHLSSTWYFLECLGF